MEERLPSIARYLYGLDPFQNEYFAPYYHIYAQQFDKSTSSESEGEYSQSGGSRGGRSDMRQSHDRDAEWEAKQA